MNALIALLLAALASAPLTPPPYDESRASVVRVVDGDTIVVRVSGFYERTVRYIGIDAPESARFRKECFGEQAKEIHRQLAEGKTLRLERDTREADLFGRLLRYAYLPDGTMVNEVLVRMGAAVVRSYPPDIRHQERLRLAESQARAEGRGLWGACRAAQPTPPAPPTPTPTIRPPTATVTVVAERLRVRAGPGTNYQQLGELPFGAIVEATGRSADGRWWQIVYQGKAAWISADYVVASQEAYALPVTSAAPQPAIPSPPPAAQPPPPPPLSPPPPPPPPQPPVAPQPAPSQPSAPPAAGGCPTGCVEQRPGCAIKGNVNARGERIYHVPGSTYYDRTSVRPEEGDRWFCTPAEAEANGFRAPAH